MIIENGSDLLLVLNLTDEKGNRIIVNTKNSFTIRVFTAERSNYLEYNKTDIVSTSDNDKLYLNSNELETLESGVIAYTYLWGENDNNFNDGEYNKQKTVYTDYYFRNRGCSNTNPSNPVDDKVIQQLKNSIKKETDRAKEAESKIVQDTANKYQAKEVGKGLSTNDYTNTEKQKLASLPDDFEPCTDAEINAMLKELGL